MGPSVAGEVFASAVAAAFGGGGVDGAVAGSVVRGEVGGWVVPDGRVGEDGGGVGVGVRGDADGGDGEVPVGPVGVVRGEVRGEGVGAPFGAECVHRGSDASCFGFGWHRVNFRRGSDSDRCGCWGFAPTFRFIHRFFHTCGWLLRHVTLLTKVSKCF